jgi:hypothetical protein
MKKAVLLLLLTLSACADRTSKPVVTIEYSPRVDSICSIFRGGGIKDAWVEELKTRKSEFENLWAKVGPRLIRATEDVTGKAFPAREFKARLTLCNLPSQSIVGISVNMRYALKSATETPVPMRYKVDTLFHELLHAYLSAHPVEKSALLERHSEESARVRNHLHLLALQKAVLLRLGETTALTDDVNFDSQLPAGDYKKAWAIVNATETGYLRFVEELRQ